MNATNVNGADSEPSCLESDTLLAKFTILRYAVLGSIISCRVWAQMNKDKKTCTPAEFFWAGCRFAMHEGVGLLIYFSTSAMMDNFSIFLVHDDAYCDYVKMVALYSMSLVTFLPNCWFAYRFQGRMWDSGELKWQILFGVGMVFMTMASFVVRLFLVFHLGWAKAIRDLLTPIPGKVVIAVLVPPIADALQSGLLILSSYLAEASKGPYVDIPDNEAHEYDAEAYHEESFTARSATASSFSRETYDEEDEEEEE